MGHHLLPDGRFQSDKFPELPPDTVAIKISRKTAPILLCLAALYRSEDREFSEDLSARAVAILRGAS